MTKSTTKVRPQTSGKTTANRRSRPVSKAATFTKKTQLIRLLSKEAGADASSISKKFGWLPHTTRAALSGLRKAGYEISSIKPGAGKKKYRITNVPAEQSAH